jgi:glycosyltransferase involved in cell wall biosynthesis
MKILHFIDELKMGGAQTHLLTMIKEMIVQYPNHEHKIVVLFEDAPLSEEFRKIGVQVECLNLRSLFQSKSYFKIIFFLKNFIRNEKPQVVETHLTWSRLLANTAAKLAGVKVRLGFEQGDIYLKSTFFKISNFISQFLFQKIIVCSDPLKKWTNNTHKIFNSKLKVMHNCVNLEEFKPVPVKELNNCLGLALPKYTFITVGTLGRGVNKRVDIPIKAIRLLKKSGLDVGLLVCGDGDQKKELQQLALDLNVSENIFFLGMRKDVSNILPNAFAFVHAAPFEPFGIVCIEAMACGLPAIVPNSGGIQNIVSDNQDGFVYEVLSENSLSEKMRLLIQNEEMYSKFVNNCVLNVKRYDVKRYVSELYKLYYAK